MKKKVISMVLSLAMTATLLAGCGSSAEQTTTQSTAPKTTEATTVAASTETTVEPAEDPYEVVMKIYNTGDLPKNMDNVMEKVNEILLRDLNMTLDLEITDKDTIYTQTIMARTDLIDKYNIDVNSIHTLADINAMFETVSAGEPGLWMIATTTSHKSENLIMMANFDGLGDGYGCLMDPFNSTEVTNMWESKEFKDFCTQIREWYNRGWINPAAATDTESYTTYLKTGQAFCAFRRYGHPLAESDVEASTNGVDLTAIHVQDPIMTSSSAKDVCYIIPYTSEDPEKAFKMIGYLMNSKEINDLLNWGVEGEDWVLDANGCATYPEGKTYDTVDYHFDAGWALPNQFLCTVWEGNDADIYQQMDAYNNTAKSSLALGFNYDNTAVADQVAKVKAVQSKYLVALMTGSVDPEEYIPMMIKEGDEAGMDDIIAEKQRQLNEWLANK